MGKAYVIDPETGERELIVEWKEPHVDKRVDILRRWWDLTCRYSNEVVDKEAIVVLMDMAFVYGDLSVIGQSLGMRACVSENLVKKIIEESWWHNPKREK